MYSILDVETTGGKFNEEGITEIAIYRFDGEKIVDQFVSLINPEIINRIPTKILDIETNVFIL